MFKTLSCFSFSKKFVKKPTYIYTTTTRAYHFIRAPPRNRALPWRYLTIPKNEEKGFPELNVALYNRGKKGNIPPNPIVMIHNLTGTHRTFDNIVRETDYPYGVVSYDMRGRGNSGEPEKGSFGLPSPYGIKNHVIDYLRVLTTLGLESCFVVGHGYGATVALNIALLHPDRISGIFLIDAGYTRIPREDNEDQRIDEVIRNEMLKEVEMYSKEFDSVEDYMRAFNVDPATATIDQRTKYTYELKQNENGKFVPKFSKKAVLADIEDLDQTNMILDTLWKIRHPITICRSEFGLTDKEKNIYLPPNRLKELRSILNVKGVVEMKGSNYRSVIEGQKNGLKLAKAIEDLVEPYDLHRQIEGFLESIRNADEQEQIDKIYFPNKIRTYEEKFRYEKE